MVSTLGQDDPKQNVILNWRKLYLSKAKLRASSRTSGLMSGFAMVAMVELNLDPNVPGFLYVIFGLLTTVLISVHVFALMISICILPNIETAEGMSDKRLDRVESGGIPPCPESPHIELQKYIEVAWIFSTGLGTLLFLLEIPLLMWVNFYTASKAAAYVSTGIMIPVSILFVIFAMHFYRKLIEHKYSRSTKEIEELQRFASQLAKDDGPLVHDSPTM